MRKLTLQRKKSIVACLCAVYPYLQCDEKDSTMLLGGVPCKCAGKLKNGKALTWEIPEEPTTLIVAWSRKFPAKYYTYCTIPAGSEDLTLYTEPTYDPSRGNPFVIMGVPKA